MKQYARDNRKSPNGIVGQFAAEKKKGIMAVCLIAVMVFMWVRVFTKESPEAAKAASAAQIAAGDESKVNAGLKISFVELPKVAGRNDVITRDFFASNGWQDFVEAKQNTGATAVEEVSLISTDGNEETAKKVTQQLHLEAIILSDNPQAFINDKLLFVGDKLLVELGAHKYECEVVRITQNTVILRCGQVQITLKLTQAIEVTD